MRKLLAPCLGVFVALAPVSALAAITQITGTGTGSSLSNVTYSGGVSPLNNDPTAIIPAGSLAIITLQTYDSSPTLSCSDAFGNTWQAAPNSAFRANAGVQIWYSFTTNSIASGANIPCTSTAPAQFTGQILGFAGAAAYDVSPTGTTGSGTSVTVGASPTLSCPGGGTGCEVCVAAVVWNSTGTITPDATWTDTNNSLSGASWANGFKIVNASTALSYTSSTSATAANAGAMACFKAAVTSTLHSRSLLGVGQ